MQEMHREITAQLDASSGERIRLRVAMKKGTCLQAVRHDPSRDLEITVCMLQDITKLL